MKSIKIFKKIIIIIFIITISIIGILTIDVIYKTEKWDVPSIDFNSKHHIISAYGTLIGGILAFLSILFVLFQVYEQREQIQLEKEEDKKNIIKERTDLLNLISSFLDSIIKDIKGQGDTIKTFYKKELKQPTLSNILYFTVNENFNRIIEMDYISIYKSFRHFLGNNDDWEKDFLNFYRSIDFYKKITPHIRDNYKSQMKEKVKLKYTLQNQVQSFLKNLHDCKNQYITTYRPPYYLKSFPWFQTLTTFWFKYKQYVDYLENHSSSKPLDSDLSDLKSTYFEPLFNEMLNLSRLYIPKKFGEKELIDELTEIIIKTKELEQFSINFANDLKQNVHKYYVEDSKNLKSLIELKSKIDEVLKK